MLILKLATYYRRNYILDVYQIVYREGIKRERGGMVTFQINLGGTFFKVFVVQDSLYYVSNDITSSTCSK